MSQISTILALFLSLFWGFAWAACLQYTRWGRWLALYRTWITVVVGVGGDLLIMLPIMKRRAWAFVATIIALSSVGIIYRSIYNEYHIDAEL